MILRQARPEQLKTSESNGEDFLAWTDNSDFLISSWGRICGGSDNLRIVDAISSEQQVIVDQGFHCRCLRP